MKHSCLRRMLAAILAVSVLLGLGSSALATQDQGRVPVSYEEMDPSQVSAELKDTQNAVEEPEPIHQEDDMVRVTIVLEEEPALAVMGREAATASTYRQNLKVAQEKLATKISTEILDGEKLDVVWNLTLTSNAISANVTYGKVDEIRAMDGVKAVYLEKRYEPMQAETTNANAIQMTGVPSVKADTGYTGAGARIAVIDTGTDTDHQSFSVDGFLYALELQAKAKGISLEEYKASLDLLTQEEIAQVLPLLNLHQRNPELTAEELYGNEKLAFNYNYVDGNLNVTHDNDEQGEHGSHVAGIATANSYIPAQQTVYDFDGDGDLDQDDAEALLSHVISGSTISHKEMADISGNGSATAYDVHLLLDMMASGEVYASAQNTVGVVGTAPEAQLITMKVFGANGGAYSSDYMVAVEDAVALGCDVVNLSLGSSAPGFAISYEDNAALQSYIRNLMEELENTGIVMAVAAGNSGNWADMDNAFGLMYTDEAGTANTSDPATFRNSLSVASVDNIATVGHYFEAQGVKVFYTENQDEGCPNRPFAGLDTSDDATGTTYEYVLVDGIGEPADYEGMDLKGKVVFCSRGTTSFGEKANAAVSRGAAAVVVYNNISGIFGMILDGYEYNAPCVAILQSEASEIRAASTAKTTAAGLTYYTGSITVYREIGTGYDESGYYTMSDFSSWGSTGGLAIKPEITAPGGAINSVNGIGPETDKYELMSGTSMATPHLTGLVALASQYLREEAVLEKARTVSDLKSLSQRQLIQSLLMSTAEPVIEKASGVEYSVRNQGSGLANIENLVNAESFILVDGQTDGKVKLELGEGTQGWTATFSLNNLTETEMVYDLSASILTTGTTVGEANGKIHTLSTDQLVKLGAVVTFTGEAVDNGKVTLPASGCTKVTVSIEIPESTVLDMVTKGYTNGFYVEGFVYLTPAEGVTHSIPLLGWYGSWTDPSMYDTGSYLEMAYGLSERPSHINSIIKNVLTWEPLGADSGYYYTGNVYGSYDGKNLIGDQRYIADRNALNTTADASWKLYAIFPTLIRNAADVEVRVTNADTGEIYWANDYEHMDDYMLASFYFPNYQQWYDTTSDYGVGVEWDGTDPATGLPVEEGTNLEIALYAAPEYYLNENENVDYSQVGDGSKLSYQFTVDNTAPALVGGKDALTKSKDGKTLYFTAQDNRYIAAVTLLNGTATQVAMNYYPDMAQSQKGTVITGSFDLEDFTAKYGNKAVIAVCDYAGNEAYYTVNLGGEGNPYGDFVALQFDPYSDGCSFASFNKDVNNCETNIFELSDRKFVCAEYINNYVFAQTASGELHAFPYEALLSDTMELETTLVARLHNVYQDLAFNYSDGCLYGVLATEDGFGYASEIYQINLEAYVDDELGEEVPAYSETSVSYRDGIFTLGMAIDDGGTFYLLVSETNDTWGENDAILWTCEVIDHYWYDSYIWYEQGSLGKPADYLQSMTWDHNTEALYWSRFHVSGLELESSLEKIELADDSENRVVCTQVGALRAETAGLMAPLCADAAAQEEHQKVPSYDRSIPARPVLTKSTLALNLNASVDLNCDFDPWYSDYTEFTWSSSNEEIATVDQSGLVTGKAVGSCEITVASVKDPSLKDVCKVSVASLDLAIEGLTSIINLGVGQSSTPYMFRYSMVDGIPASETFNQITAPEEFQGFGLSIASSTLGRGSMWACEFGNTGMIYEIDAKTGVVKDMLEPIDGDMMFGMAYSEEMDIFTGIMNYYLYVDQPFTEDVKEEMLDSYDETLHEFTWHKFDMSSYLNASQGSFTTKEEGTTDIVFAGITNIPGGQKIANRYTDYLGRTTYSAAYYTTTTTWALLDNVGRIWYIDEVAGLSEDSESTGYANADGSIYINAKRPGVFAQEYVAEDGTVTYNVFVIREIVETPLCDMFLDGNLGITYHFSALYYTEDAAGKPAFFMSLYDYWNGSAKTVMYLYVPGEETGETDWETLEPIRTPEMFFELNGSTGRYFATINYAELTGGLKAESENSDVYVPQNTLGRWDYGFQEKLKNIE